MKILSEHYGTDIDREAHVHYDEGFFNSIDEAENFAENYVLGESHEP